MTSGGDPDQTFYLIKIRKRLMRLQGGRCYLGISPRMLPPGRKRNKKCRENDKDESSEMSFQRTLLAYQPQ